MFTAGIAVALAAGNVYFRDLTYLWTIVAQAWFFMTPIVYPPSIVEGRIPHWAFLIFDHLPMAVTARVFRNIMYDLRFPAALDWGLMAMYGTVTLLFGWWVFTKLEGRFAEEL
jgi:ABC-2 type transport system permease protein